DVGHCGPVVGGECGEEAVAPGAQGRLVAVGEGGSGGSGADPSEQGGFCPSEVDLVVGVVRQLAPLVRCAVGRGPRWVRPWVCTRREPDRSGTHLREGIRFDTAKTALHVYVPLCVFCGFYSVSKG